MWTGEMALLSNERRSATVVSKGETECLMLNREDFNTVSELFDHFCTFLAVVWFHTLRTRACLASWWFIGAHTPSRGEETKTTTAATARQWNADGEASESVLVLHFSLVGSHLPIFAYTLVAAFHCKGSFHGEQYPVIAFSYPAWRK